MKHLLQLRQVPTPKRMGLDGHTGTTLSSLSVRCAAKETPDNGRVSRTGQGADRESIMSSPSGLFTRFHVDRQPPTVTPWLVAPRRMPVSHWGVERLDVDAWTVACLKSGTPYPAGVLAASLMDASTLFGVLPAGHAAHWVRYATTTKVLHPVCRPAPSHQGGFRFLGGMTPLFLAAGISPAAIPSWSAAASGMDMSVDALNATSVVYRVADRAHARGWSVFHDAGIWSVSGPSMRP